MPRPKTLFTGQWADLPSTELFPRAKAMGYDGLELACWGDHFDVTQAEDPAYLKARWELLADNGLNCFALSNHLVGQATCDPIDQRHQAILPPEVWGDGDPEGVRQRAADQMKAAARAARAFFDARPPSLGANPLHPVVNGFTGSSIWHALYAFPPTSQSYLQDGYEDFANRWIPILNVFEEVDVNFALEVHPTEIAFDTVTAERALKAVNGHKRFGFNYDPSHLAYQGVDYVGFIRRFADRIYHVHMKDVWWGHGTGESGVFGGHLDFTQSKRYWDFRSLGRGDVDFEEIIVALNEIGYQGPLSVEWEDGYMDRFHGATEACEFLQSLDFAQNAQAFDAAFERK